MNSRLFRSLQLQRVTGEMIQAYSKWAQQNAGADVIPFELLARAAISAAEPEFTPTHHFVEGGDYQHLGPGVWKEKQGDTWQDAQFYRTQHGVLCATSPARWTARFLPLVAL